MKKALILLCILCFNSHAQIDNANENFYLKAHSLIDEMLRKDKGGIIMAKTFNFCNKKDLGNSPLYDKMLGSYERWSVTSREVNISLEDYNYLKDKTGWIRDSIAGCYNHWDKRLLPNSTPILVDSLLVQRKRELRDPIAFRPVQINFKGNLAIIEYEVSKELELAAYILYKGNWQLIGVGSYFVPRQE